VSEAAADATADAATGTGAWIAVTAVLLAAIAVMFGRLFTGDVSILTGDNLTHSFPLNERLYEALHGGGFRFWERSVATGVPLYADGTTGWFHPMKLALFAVLPLLAAHDLLYVASFFLTGLSCLWLCRLHGLGPLSALLGALAVTFSPAVLGNAYNASYALALAWSAVALVAFEWWYREPTLRRVVVLAIAIALEVLASYPPLAYALLFFFGLLLALRLPFERDRRVARGIGFGGAVALALGLAAFQVLPLAELTARSVRHAALDPLQAFPWPYYLAGLVFSNDPTLYAPGRYAYFFVAPLGTALAGLSIAFVPLLADRIALSYVGAIALSVGAAGGVGSPIYELLRLVLPGFDRLRLISPFVFVTLVPAGFLLAKLLAAAVDPNVPRRRLRWCAAVGMAFAILLATSWPLHAATASYRGTFALVLAVGLLALVGLRFARRLALATPLLVAALLIEIFVSRSSFLTYLPDAILAEDRDLATFLAARQREDPSARGAHFANDESKRTLEDLVLQHAKSPGYAGFARTFLRTLSPYVNVMHDVAFLEANDALPLASIPALRDAIQAELHGRASAPVGRRLVDRFRVRWVVVQGTPVPFVEGFREVWRDPDPPVVVLENTLVAPPVQLDERPIDASAVAVTAPRWAALVAALPWVASEPGGAFDVDAAAPGSAFVPIAAYPGWSAAVDGAPVALYAAEGGAAMELPIAAGHHRIELSFVPYSFHAGVAIALASALAALALARPARSG
jgi:hypothetical protein